MRLAFSMPIFPWPIVIPGFIFFPYPHLGD